MKKIFSSERLLDHVIQFIFIFSSVYFAFWLTERREVKAIKDIEQLAIVGLYQEINFNMQSIKNVAPYHKTVSQRFNVYLDSLESLNNLDLKQPAINYLMQLMTRSEGGAAGYVALQDNAWNTLRNSKAHTELSYEAMRRISSLYTLQNNGVQSTLNTIINEIFATQKIYESNNIISMLRFTGNTYRELHAQERTLYNEYQVTSDWLVKEFPYLDEQQTE